MAEKTIDVAMESSVQEVKTVADNIYEKVDTEVASVVTNTATNNTASATGTLSQKLSYIASSLLGATGATGGSTTAGTVMGKLNKIISDLTTHISSWTSARAGYIDNIRSYTVTNNTASKTGVLSAKLAYVISLLENSTYGLNALKTALSSSSGGITIGTPIVGNFSGGIITTPSAGYITFGWTDSPNTYAVLDISLDGGATWTSLSVTSSGNSLYRAYGGYSLFVQASTKFRWQYGNTTAYASASYIFTPIS